jgi:hypothetical protein
MNREIPGEVAMRFHVRDLMSNVLPLKMAGEGDCGQQSTTVKCITIPPCTECTQQSPKPKPKMAREMLDILRDQMRKLLLPA